MATLLQRCESEDLALAVDAKVGKGKHAWRIASIGVLGKIHLSRSSLRRNADGDRIQCLVYTTSFRPIMQAVMHWETNVNYVDFFNIFVQLGALVLGISENHFKTTIRRMHKDFNDSIEYAREAVMKTVRPCGDSTHQNANFGLQLPKKCVNAQCTEPTVLSTKPHHVQIAEGMRVICGVTPTIAYFAYYP